MTRIDKLIEEFKKCRGPFPYADLVRLLNGLGYEEGANSGGSGRRFVHAKTRHIIKFHEPHPGTEIKIYLVKEIRQSLADKGLL